ncbi:MAG: hypothetical protein GTO14_20380 [Anaerolineales bacterium]|nr:hypothetical protein [Anaerolineales bacterium]
MHEKIFAAGGEHIPATWGEFACQTGVSAILHLNALQPSKFLGPPPEMFLWLDVVDESHAGLDERHLVARFLRECLIAGHSVLLHSGAGRHRTRWVFVSYWIAEGRSVRAALRMAAERPWLAPYHTEEESWRAFAAVCLADRPG